MKARETETHRSILDALEPYENPDDVTLVFVRRLKGCDFAA
ncbi:hypothetical protein QUF72_15930 [Desulfobacterales bacterium HSG2]|nr:hypothetical protein [Desulfobacterales bacterium HSG2]